MNLLVLPLARVFALAAVLLTASSCLHMKPANREFHDPTTYFDGDNMEANEVATSEEAQEALKRIPKEPDFQQLDLKKNLASSYLRKPTGPYRVGPGDVLDIEVAEKAETRAKTRVLPDGMLHYNVARGVKVSGKTLREVSNTLSVALQDDYVNPVVAVNVSSADSQRFHLLGQVKKPGSYAITKPTTVIDAISKGEGLLYSPDGGSINNPEAADLNRAILIRNGELVPVDFEALIHKGDMSQNAYIKGGDYLFIPSRVGQSVYVLGQVTRPGPVSYERGTTLLSAFAVAGGPKPEAIVNKVLIIRGSTRQPMVAVVDVRAVSKGKQPDLALEGGDIVWVPKSPWTKLNQYTEAVLITASQAIAIQEGLGAFGTAGGSGVTISAGGF